MPAPRTGLNFVTAVEAAIVRVYIRDMAESHPFWEVDWFRLADDSTCREGDPEQRPRQHTTAPSF